MTNAGRKVAVITGGGSGMGLEVAKLMPYDVHVIITGRTEEKLAAAVSELAEACVDASYRICDVTNAGQVADLVEYALSKGEVRMVVHAAGIGPKMGDALEVFRTNAVGTLLVNRQFADVMEVGGVILNIASMAGHMLPEDRVPKEIWLLSRQGPDALLRGFADMVARVHGERDGGMAYTLSKNFVLWLTRHMAVAYGRRGLRVVSISPGTIVTPMVMNDGPAGIEMAQEGPLGRVGETPEIARTMMFMLTGATYMTGTDVLYDGGVIAGLEATREQEDELDRQSALRG